MQPLAAKLPKGQNSVLHRPGSVLSIPKPFVMGKRSGGINGWAKGKSLSASLSL
jgi:hypothetical protein